MFEIDDDFDIDEEFLEGVFAVEKDVQSNFTIKSSTSHSIDSEESTETTPSKRRKCDNQHDNDSNSSLTTSLNTTGGSELNNFLLGITPAPSCVTSAIETATSEQFSFSRGPPSERSFHCESEANKPNKSSFSSIFKNDALIDRDGGVQREKTHFLSTKVRNNNESGHSSNIRNQWKTPFPPQPTKKLERKFPGPAGLLPERQNQRVPFSAINTEHPEIDDEEDSGEPLCSQSAISVLEESPWLTLKRAYTSDLLDRFTIAWIKRKAASRQLVGQKVPFLAAVLQSLDCSSPDPCLVLRDSTGEIPGTLHRLVWDQYGGQLTLGSAIVLRLVGVLSTGVAARRNYLNITENNLVAIYSANNSFALPSSSPSQATTGNVRVTQVHKVPISELRQIARNWEEESRKSKEHGSSITEPFAQPTTSLFNTLLPNVQPSKPQQVQRSNVPPVIRSNYAHSTVSSSAAKPSSVPVNSRQSTNETFKSTSSFVAKKPSLVLQTSCNNLQKNTQISNSQESHFSTDHFDDADDLELSSVLDGIDCSTIFGN